MPPVVHDPEAAGEIRKLQAELEAMRLKNATKALAPPPLPGYPGVPLSGYPPVTEAEHFRLREEAVRLRQMGQPTQASLVEKRANEVAALAGAKFPDVPHAVEREQAEVLSSRQMMEQAALRYGLDIFGLESARVFQDGWHMRDQELHLAREAEEAQARESF